MSRKRKRGGVKPASAPLVEADVQAMADAVLAAWFAIYPAAIAIVAQARRPDLLGARLLPELQADVLCGAFGALVTALGPETKAEVLAVMRAAIDQESSGGPRVGGTAGQGGRGICRAPRGPSRWGPPLSPCPCIWCCCW